MTEVGHKDETVRDQGLITSLVLRRCHTLFSVVFVYYFIFSVVAFFYYNVLYCYLLFLVNLIL